jgi:hypothetical protein
MVQLESKSWEWKFRNKAQGADVGSRNHARKEGMSCKTCRASPPRSCSAPQPVRLRNGTQSAKAQIGSVFMRAYYYCHMVASRGKEELLR